MADTARKAASQGDGRAFWERFAGLYGPFMARSGGLYREICAGIRPYLCREMNVLEAACGTGQLSRPLSGWVRLWEATDFSPAMIRQARAEPGSARLRFSVQDVTALPYGPGTFDAAVIANALHIMPEPERALAELARVVRRGGLLFAPTFVHGEGRGYRLRMRLLEAVGFRTFHRWDGAEFPAFLEANGFRVLEHRILGGSLTPLCFVVARNGGISGGEPTEVGPWEACGAAAPDGRAPGA